MYSLDKPGEFKSIVDTQFIACMVLPSGGRNTIPQRLQRHFTCLNITMPTDSSVQRIYGTILSGFFSPERYDVKNQNCIVLIALVVFLLW